MLTVGFWGKMEKINFEHIPVMLSECIDGLNIKPKGVYIDGTLGGGGHSSYIVKLLSGGKLIGLDKDNDALAHCREKFRDVPCVQLVKSDFVDMDKVAQELGLGGVDGILLDLGVSSYQIDTAERGFSYIHDGKLDMRMNQDQSVSAYNIVNEYSEGELVKMLYDNAEEKHAKLIARGIVRAREQKAIEGTQELVNIIEGSIPRKFWGKGSVAKKTFQAIRIEVNGELKNLERALRNGIELLNSGGRFVVITFHSLEDRIVKNVFKEYATGCVCDKSLPVCVCGHKASVKLITHKPLVATEGELKFNKRSSSAKVRIIEKL